jgi:hypothetical protein
MEIEFKEDKVIFNRVLSDLDKFVIDFVKILNHSRIEYVIVSGYVSILFGRARATEDIDILTEEVKKDSFMRLADHMNEQRLWIINTSNLDMAFDMLKQGDAIRIARKGEAIPNIELKIAKDEYEKEQVRRPLITILNGFEIHISRIENQIAYKFYLGSEKDVEDAIHLLELFRNRLDRTALLTEADKLDVRDVVEKYV